MGLAEFTNWNQISGKLFCLLYHLLHTVHGIVELEENSRSLVEPCGLRENTLKHCPAGLLIDSMWTKMARTQYSQPRPSHRYLFFPPLSMYIPNYFRRKFISFGINCSFSKLFWMFQYIFCLLNKRDSSF